MFFKAAAANPQANDGISVYRTARTGDAISQNKRSLSICLLKSNASHANPSEMAGCESPVLSNRARDATP